MKTEFKLKSEFIELIKLLKIAGVCDSGGQAKGMVESEMVFVDGELETRKKKKIRSGQVVQVDGAEIRVI